MLLDFLAYVCVSQNIEFKKKFYSYNSTFDFTLIHLQSNGFELGQGVHTYKIQKKFYHMIRQIKPNTSVPPKFL